MAKSLLSTKEIQELKEVGVNEIGIADIAGISAVAVRVRLLPDRNREKAKRVYRNLNAENKKAYCIRQTARERVLQEKSIAAGISQPSGGRLWSEEEIQYLRMNGTTKTALEMALHLKRTFVSVARAAQRYRIKLNKE
ncbi:MAG: hypothetical protein AAB345_02335 [Patescibacteria group bacterium]